MVCAGKERKDLVFIFLPNRGIVRRYHPGGFDAVDARSFVLRRYLDLCTLTDVAQRRKEQPPTASVVPAKDAIALFEQSCRFGQVTDAFGELCFRSAFIDGIPDVKTVDLDDADGVFWYPSPLACRSDVLVIWGGLLIERDLRRSLPLDERVIIISSEKWNRHDSDDEDDDDPWFLISHIGLLSEITSILRDY